MPIDAHRVDALPHPRRKQPARAHPHLQLRTAQARRHLKMHCLHAAILCTLEAFDDGLLFAELIDAVRQRTGAQRLVYLGLLAGHVTTVTLELELRDEVRRVKAAGRTSWSCQASFEKSAERERRIRPRGNRPRVSCRAGHQHEFAASLNVHTITRTS